MATFCASRGTSLDASCGASLVHPGGSLLCVAMHIFCVSRGMPFMRLEGCLSCVSWDAFRCVSRYVFRASCGTSLVRLKDVFGASRGKPWVRLEIRLYVCLEEHILVRLTGHLWCISWEVFCSS